MLRMLSPGEKPLDWVGSSKKDFLGFPVPVKDEMGNALGVAQFGGSTPSAKPWKGQGSGVFEVVEDHDGDTYRAVYTVRLREVVYVLYAFPKKSTRGIRTAQVDVDLVERLKVAQQDRDSKWRNRIMRAAMASRSAETVGDEAITRGTGNVFADLGYADSEERQTKLRLVHAINNVIARRRLTQAIAAERLRVNQPKVSALANFNLDRFSVERLMTFLTALDQDVEIIIRNKSRSRPAGRISVVAA